MVEIPRKILNNSVFNELARLDRCERYQIVITTSGTLFEISHKTAIVKSLSLFKDNSNINLTNVHISVQFYFSYVTFFREVFYLIYFKELKRLTVVKRAKSDKSGGEAIELQLHQVLQNVSMCQVKTDPFAFDKSNNKGTKVHVHFDTDAQPLITDFSDTEIDNDVPLLDQFLLDFLNQAREATLELKEKLNDPELAQLFKELDLKHKFVPLELRSQKPGENAPLLQYGDVVYRTYNKHLFIGIPVINVTYER